MISFVLKRFFWIVSLLVMVGLLWPGSVGQAQEPTADGPIYIVQPGDTLWDIAVRFNVALDALMRANHLGQEDWIQAGDRLVIPGLEGIEGVIYTKEVGLGENLHSLSLRYGVAEEVIIRLNRLVSPAEIYAGRSLVLTGGEEDGSGGRRVTLESGQSLLEAAILAGSDPWTLAARNGLQASWAALPGETLRAPGESDGGPGALPAQIEAIELSPLVQGQTAVLRLKGSEGATLSGRLMNRPLNIFALQPGEYVALQGVHAMAEAGLYELVLEGTLPNNTPLSFSQQVLVNEGSFYYENLYVDPGTIDPAVTKPEDAEWASLAAPVTPEKYWEGMFAIPVEPVFADCWPSRFGSRRSYNDSGYQFFHTGLDFCGAVGDNIYAPAPGIVVFAGFLNVRGNATLINHGWGVYTGYMHQSEILVTPGERVETGQLIGRVGNTGRVTGPHLHFEVWVGGVQVDPLSWLERAFP